MSASERCAFCGRNFGVAYASDRRVDRVTSLAALFDERVRQALEDNPDGSLCNYCHIRASVSREAAEVLLATPLFLPPNHAWIVGEFYDLSRNGAIHSAQLLQVGKFGLRFRYRHGEAAWIRFDMMETREGGFENPFAWRIYDASKYGRRGACLVHDDCRRNRALALECTRRHNTELWKERKR